MAVETKAARRPVIAVLPRVSQALTTFFMWLIIGGVGLVLLGNLIKTPAQFVSVMLLGITFGAIYALVALGYTLVYGIIELINFAHGDVFMWGTMVTVTVAAHWLGLNGVAAGVGDTLGCLADAARRDDVLRRRSTSSSSASPTGRCATRRSSRR